MHGVRSSRNIEVVVVHRCGVVKRGLSFVSRHRLLTRYFVNGVYGMYGVIWRWRRDENGAHGCPVPISRHRRQGRESSPTRSRLSVR